MISFGPTLHQYPENRVVLPNVTEILNERRAALSCNPETDLSKKRSPVARCQIAIR